MLTPHRILKVANKLTTDLISDEIGLLEDVMSGSRNRKAENLRSKAIEQWERIEEIAQSCVPGESAVLRLGYGSGYRFITGSWLDWDTLGKRGARSLASAVRRNDRYQFIEPAKSRRLLADGTPLGFVKLEIL